MPDSNAVSPPVEDLLPGDAPRTAAAGRAVALLPAVKELTERHFPEGPVEVELEFDPDVPSDGFFVLSVTASGSAKQIAARQRAWRREIRQLVADQFDAFRLSVRDIV